MSTANPHLVVYIDDDSDDIDLVRTAFEMHTQRVQLVTFEKSDEGLSYLRRLQTLPCLIILDLNMPGMNGKELLVKLRSMPAFDEVPVVMFTTSSLPFDQAFAEKYKAGFVTKPLDYRQMEVITTQFLDHCSESVRANIRGLG